MTWEVNRRNVGFSAQSSGSNPYSFVLKIANLPSRICIANMKVHLIKFLSLIKGTSINCLIANS